MAVTYMDPPVDAMKMMASVLKEYFPPLTKLQAGLDVQMKFCFGDDGPALKKNGWPADAMISVVPLKMRAFGGPDVVIEVDAEAWKVRTDRQRQALLHHELHHVDVTGLQESRKEPGVYICKLDSLGRPKVTLRHHDWELGGFRELATLYEEDAPEIMALRSVVAKLDEGVFDFMRADADPATVPMATQTG